MSQVVTNAAARATLTEARTMSSPSSAGRTMQLRALLAGVEIGSPRDVDVDIDITDLTLDSRSVRPGAAFVALPGLRTHGIGFAAQAASAGARAILWEPVEGVAAPKLPSALAVVAIPHLSALIGALADRFFGAPSEAVRVVGVTGTNGKTTTAHLIASAAQQLGISSAYAGTLGFGRIGALESATHTTPDSITVHRQIAELRAAGVRCLGMEVSSHALDQKRVDSVRFETAVFTNLTRDHLDYHGTLDAYGAAKAKLFGWPGLKHAIVNARDAFGREILARNVRATAVTAYTRGPAQAQADRAGTRNLFARSAAPGSGGLRIEIDGSWGAATLQSRFVGDFNVENLLAALATLLGWNVPLHDAVAALERCDAPAGRMETLTAPGKPLVIVDYAHTPDALENVLAAARRHCSGKLMCVFGCGGDRDPGKRPLMGALAERLADRAIVTDDNPRTEDGDRIVADIVAGFADPQRAIVERDRQAAIRRAISEAAADDVVLIAGKGHEDYQIVGTERRHFSDREVALNALGERP